MLVVVKTGNIVPALIISTVIVELFGLQLLREIRFNFLGCFNATFSNISAISWRPVLLVREARVSGEYHLQLQVECTFFVMYTAGREHTPYW